MSFSKQLKEARKKTGLTQQEVANLLGVDSSTYCGYETGKRQPDPQKIKQLSNILNTSGDFLLETGFEPESINEQFSKNDLNLVFNYNKLDEHGKEVVDNLINAEIKRIEQEKNKSKVKKLIAKMSVITYDLPASAGTGAFLDGDDCEHVEYPVDDVPYGTDFAVKIQGDSMEPDYMDGGVAFVRKQSEINDGNIGIFVLNGEGYIKQIEYRKGTAYLVSLNPAYKDIKVLDTDNFRCSGKVLN